jgi:predicted RNase H-like HicB family nuclease
MTLYHVSVARDGKWYVGRVLERRGITTQGRSLDELVVMLRDAIDALWNERDVQLELVLASETSRAPRSRGARRRASA